MTADRSTTRREFILASGSPRRRRMLADLGLRFVIDVPDVDESWPDDDPDQAVALARRKLGCVAARRRPGELLLAADTIVHLDGRVLGKPADEAAARAMLARLSSREHTVTGGVAVGVVGGEVRTIRVDSRVRLRSLDTRTIAAYVAGGSPLDKAGAYAVQDDLGGRFPAVEAILARDRDGCYVPPPGAFLVAGVTGSLSNVIGLPLEPSLELLRRQGLEVPRER